MHVDPLLRLEIHPLEDLGLVLFFILDDFSAEILSSRLRYGAAMKQIYKITYPTGKIYVGKDSVGSFRYFGSPDMDIVNADFESLPDNVRHDYTIRKQILWESPDCSESDLSAKEVEFIRSLKSNDPAIGYNRWPKPKSD